MIEPSISAFLYINMLDIFSLSQVKTDMKMYITSEKSCCKSTNKKREHLQKNKYWKMNKIKLMSSAINLQQISSRSSAHLLEHLCKKIIDVKVFFEKYVKILSIHFNNTLDISLGLSILSSQGGYYKCTL